MVAVYQLSRDTEHIANVQKATLTSEQFGIQQTHGLFGSPEWWRKIESGELPVHRLRGKITDVFMGSMRDWPMFKMRTDSGEESSWTRFANTKELSDIYAAGRSVELDYVVQRFKPKSWSGDSETKVVIEVRVDDAA